MPFTSDTVRLIRVDFSGHGSGYSTPRATDAPDNHILGAGDDDVLLFTGDKDRDKTRVKLESKVARVAGKKCSVEEVKHLHQELRNWLSTDKKRDEQVSFGVQYESSPIPVDIICEALPNAVSDGVTLI